MNDINCRQPPYAQINSNGRLQVRLRQIIHPWELTPDDRFYPNVAVTYDGRLWSTIGSELVPVERGIEISDSVIEKLAFDLRPSYRWTITLQSRWSKEVPKQSTHFDWTGFEPVLS